MSRIGKQPIQVPQGVKVDINGGKVKVTGPKGNMEHILPKNISLEMDKDTLLVKRSDDERTSRSLHGLTRALVHNMVHGVSAGFVKELDIIGVGYKAQMRGKDILNIYVGHSHSIDFFIPKGVTAAVEPGKGVTRIKLEGCDKQLVGELAAQIRSLREPEPYKGKGIRYSTEVIKKKVGKAVVGSK